MRFIGIFFHVSVEDKMKLQSLDRFKQYMLIEIGYTAHENQKKNVEATS